MHKIRTYNKIAEQGLKILNDKNCAVGEDQKDAAGIILRSYKMQPEDINPEVLGIARACAG